MCSRHRRPTRWAILVEAAGPRTAHPVGRAPTVVGYTNTVDAATVASILGALGVGSIAGQYVLGGRQRRELRALVLAALGACESARWVHLTGRDTDVPNFPELIRSFEAAALVARVPRSAVRHYGAFAFTAFWLSRASAEYDPEGEGGIGSEFAAVVSASAALVADLAWHPWRRRVVLARRTSELARRAASAADDDEDVQRWLKMARERVV